MLIHDSFSSVGVTLALLTDLLPSHDFRYVARSGSLAEYRRVPSGGPGRARSALRQAAELPWFVRNVLIKVLLVARLPKVAKLLGSDGGWPY
jgi:hypothetical protein